MDAMSASRRRSGRRRLPRRLALVGGLLFLGWLGLAIASATSAAAAADPSGASDRAATSEVPAPPAQRAPLPAPVIAIPVPATSPPAVTSVVPASPVPTSVVPGSVESTLAPVIAPLERTVSDATAQLAPTVIDPLTYAAAAILGGATPTAAAPAPASGAPARAGSSVSPPARLSAARIRPAVAGPLPAAESRRHGATGPSSTLVGPRPLSVAGAPAVAAVRSGSGGLDLPAPQPVIPSGSPGVLATFGLPASSNSGQGNGALPGFGTGKSWAAHQLSRLGVVDRGGARFLRDSIPEPSVSPD